MPDVFEQKQEEIAAVCKQFGIQRLFVFGSALRADYRPGESDVDLLVEFRPMDITKRVHVYFEVLHALKEVFRSDIDLIMLGAVKNRIIAKEIDRTKRLVYGAP